MPTLPRLISTLTLLFMLIPSAVHAQLVLSGLVDGPLSGGTPKAIELYATQDIPDLSVCGVELVSNAGSTAGTVETAFTGSINAGERYYVATEEVEFTAVFGFAPNQTSNDVNHNGDDDVYIYCNGALVDVWGGSDGLGNSGTDYDILDSYAYRKDGEGPNTTFTISEWTIAPPNTLDGLDAPTLKSTLPFGTYQSTSSGPDPEPSEHATQFSATSPDARSITLTWNDAVSGNIPAGYVIYASTDVGALPAPVDGTPAVSDSDLSDGSAVAIIVQGLQTATFRGARPGQTWHFQIWSYSNSGETIDYKTAVSGPATSATTQRGSFNQTFESGGPGDWLIYSVSSNRDWIVDDYAFVGTAGADGTTSYAVVNNFGADVAADDWLISPPIDLSVYSNPTLGFMIYKRFSDDASFGLEAYLSTDYPGNGDPSASTWNPLGLESFGYPAADTTWEERMLDLSAHASETGAVIAFRHQSSGTSAGSSVQWRLDEISLNSAARIDGEAGWRLLAFPTSSGGSAADLLDDTAVQGIPGTQGSEFDANLLLYGSDGQLRPPASLESQLEPGQGFALYFFDNSSAGSQPLPVTLDKRGPEPVSTVSTPLNTVPGSLIGGSHFTLVGNPYGRPYSLSDLQTDVCCIQENIQTWDPAVGSYVPVAWSQYVASPWQGFFVETVADGTVPTQLQFSLSGIGGSGSGKSLHPTSAERMTGPKAKTPSRATMRFRMASSNSEVQDVALRLESLPEAELGYDSYDAAKLTPLSEHFGIIGFTGTNGLQSVYSLPDTLAKPVEIPMEGIFSNVHGGFTLEWHGIDEFPETWSLQLMDPSTGSRVDMRTQDSHSFHVEESMARTPSTQTILLDPRQADAASGDGTVQRFTLRIEPASSAVSIDDFGAAHPSEFKLHDAYPNPFNPSTTIRYSLSRTARVQLNVYDLAGRRIAVLVDGILASGEHTLQWNAEGASSGVYLIRLESQGRMSTRSVILAK